MDAATQFLQMDSRMLRLAVISLLLLVNSIAAAPGGLRDTQCLLRLQEDGELSAKSIAEFERCRENSVAPRFRIDPRSENALISDERSDITLKCLLVIEAAKSILEKEVYDRLRSCYQDSVCSSLMGPCEATIGATLR